MSADPTPVTDLAGKEVYTADAVRVGRVVDVVVDLVEGTPVALALADVPEGVVGRLPDGAAGLRVPLRYVRGAGDAVVLRVSAREAAFPLPGGDAGADGESDESGGAGVAGGIVDGGEADGTGTVPSIGDGPGSSDPAGGPDEPTDGDPIV